MVAKLPFGFEQPEDSPGFLLWQATVAWQRLLKEVLQPFELSHAQFVVMAVTGWFESNEQAPTQTDIIQKTKLDKMTVSKSLKQLVEKGWVKRVENQEDTRSKLVGLTAVGRRKMTKVIPAIEAADKQFFSSLNTKEMQAWKKLNSKLVTEFY